MLKTLSRVLRLIFNAAIVVIAAATLSATSLLMGFLNVANATQQTQPSFDRKSISERFKISADDFIPSVSPDRFKLDGGLDATLPTPQSIKDLIESDGNANQSGQQAGLTGKPDFAFGAYQRGYYLTALNLALPRAQDGDAAAQTLIGELYERGLGVNLNRKEAASWYKLAAASGNREAQFLYSLMLIEGKVVQPDRAQAQSYMEKAAKSGHVKAKFNLAQMIVNARPTFAGFEMALPLFKESADSGLADAQYAMSQIHANAMGVPVSDFVTARKWLLRAAQGGIDTAQVDLAIWLANGKGGKRDPEGAFRWMRRVAEGGNVIGQNRLAKMYLAGIGTKADDLEAAKWHIIARRSGRGDPELDTLLKSLSLEDQRKALDAANRWPAR